MSTSAQFQNWVGSMETTWGDSWQRFEFYSRVVNYKGDRMVFTLVAIDGVITQMLVEDYAGYSVIEDLSAFGFEQGMETWGMGLHERGYRKQQEYFYNTMSREYANFNAPAFFRAINAGNNAEAFAWVMGCDELAVY